MATQRLADRIFSIRAQDDTADGVASAESRLSSLGSTLSGLQGTALAVGGALAAGIAEAVSASQTFIQQVEAGLGRLEDSSRRLSSQLLGLGASDQAADIIGAVEGQGGLIGVGADSESFIQLLTRAGTGGAAPDQLIRALAASGVRDETTATSQLELGLASALRQNLSPGDLARYSTTYAGTLNALGLDFAGQAEFLGDINQVGSVRRVLPGVSSAVLQAVQAGQDPRAAVDQLLSSFAATSSPADAIRLGLEQGVSAEGALALSQVGRTGRVGFGDQLTGDLAALAGTPSPVASALPTNEQVYDDAILQAQLQGGAPAVAAGLLSSAGQIPQVGPLIDSTLSPLLGSFLRRRVARRLEGQTIDQQTIDAAGYGPPTVLYDQDELSRFARPPIVSPTFTGPVHPDALIPVGYEPPSVRRQPTPPPAPPPPPAPINVTIQVDGGTVTSAASEFDIERLIRNAAPEVLQRYREITGRDAYDLIDD